MMTMLQATIDRIRASVGRSNRVVKECRRVVRRVELDSHTLNSLKEVVQEADRSNTLLKLSIDDMREYPIN